MNMSSLIWRHIESLGPDAIFTSKQICRELCVSRNATDTKLSRLVKQNILVRLAAGVFILSSSMTQMPVAAQIIAAKADAFEKRILEPAKYSPGKQQANPNEFLSDGCRTAFNSQRGRLHFKSVSAHKLRKLDEKLSPPAQSGKLAAWSEPNCPIPNEAQIASNPALTILLAVLVLKQALNSRIAKPTKVFNKLTRSSAQTNSIVSVTTLAAPDLENCVAYKKESASSDSGRGERTSQAYAGTPLKLRE